MYFRWQFWGIILGCLSLARLGLAQLCLVWPRLAQMGQCQISSVWLGIGLAQPRSDLDWLGLALLGLAQCGPARFWSDWLGLARPSPAQIGSARLGHGRCGDGQNFFPIFQEISY